MSSTNREISSDDFYESYEKICSLIIQSAIDYAIFTIDLNGNVTSWNSGAENILGYKKDEMVGQPALIIFTDEDRQKNIPEKEFQVALRDSKAEDERWHVRKSGARFWASGMLMPMRDRQNKVIGFVKILRDRTEERLIKKELERSNEELEQFAYIVSHDLKSPLNVIDNYIELLVRRYKNSLDEKAQAFTKYITENIKLLRSMIDELLAYSQVRKADTKFSEVSLDKIYKKAIAALIIEIKQKNAVIKCGQLPKVMGVETLLTLLFQNIIGNALKYCKKEPHIEVNSVFENDQWLISIRDNGIGLKSENLDKIFSPFTRLHHNDEYPGHGLGLATAKKIVEFHGGKIWVESTPHQGSTFRFTLPK